MPSRTCSAIHRNGPTCGSGREAERGHWFSHRRTQRVDAFDLAESREHLIDACCTKPHRAILLIPSQYLALF